MPWADLLVIAQKHLAIAPEAFWRLSVVEWNCLMKCKLQIGSGTMSRNDLNTLVAQYPDNPANEV